ncbi:hypothetical protein GCM10023068_39790 [Leifsonia shinshuensis]
MHEVAQELSVRQLTVRVEGNDSLISDHELVLTCTPNLKFELVQVSCRSPNHIHEQILKDSLLRFVEVFTEATENVIEFGPGSRAMPDQALRDGVQTQWIR